MRTMKDKERFYIVVKVFLSIYGPATAKEICDYLKNCPVRMQKEFTPIKVGLLLRGQAWAKKYKENNKDPWKYEIKV